MKIWIGFDWIDWCYGQVYAMERGVQDIVDEEPGDFAGQFGEFEMFGAEAQGRGE